MTDNRNTAALRDFADRAVAIEMELREAREIAKEAKKDLKTEVKGSYDKTGVEWAEVASAAKTRLAKKSLAQRRRELEDEAALMELLGYTDADDPMAP